MVIREQQITAFNNAGEERFRNEMVEHIREFAPKLFEVIREEGARQAVDHAMERAKSYQLRNRGPIRFYIEAMLSFGSYWDSDPQLPWAAQILNDVETDEGTRAQLLFAKTHEYYETVMGPDNAWGLDAMRRIANTKLPDLAPASGEFHDRVLAGMVKMYPQKYWYAGERVLYALVDRAMELARSYSLQEEPGAALLAGLMFGFGHGVATDPLYPWVGRALNDKLIDDPRNRVLRLHDKVMVYVRRVLEYASEG